MNDEKNLLDEIWEAVGLDKPEPPADEPKSKETPKEESAGEVTAEEVEETPAQTAEEEPAQEPEKEPVQEPAEKEEKAPAPKTTVTPQKKDVRFLVIYTVAFVVVISFLIAGSYLITSRIHREMAANNASLDSSQSTLKNIQDENRSLKEQNAALQTKNEQLTASQAENDALLESVGDMVEHGEYLSAAQDAYIRGDRTTARRLLAAVERDKLAEPAKEYYDTLNDRLN